MRDKFTRFIPAEEDDHARLTSVIDDKNKFSEISVNSEYNVNEASVVGVINGEYNVKVVHLEIKATKSNVACGEWEEYQNCCTVTTGMYVKTVTSTNRESILKGPITYLYLVHFQSIW